METGEVQLQEYDRNARMQHDETQKRSETETLMILPFVRHSTLPSRHLSIIHLISVEGHLVTHHLFRPFLRLTPLLLLTPHKHSH